MPRAAKPKGAVVRLVPTLILAIVLAATASAAEVALTAEPTATRSGDRTAIAFAGTPGRANTTLHRACFPSVAAGD